MSRQLTDSQPNDSGMAQTELKQLWQIWICLGKDGRVLQNIGTPRLQNQVSNYIH